MEENQVHEQDQVEESGDQSAPDPITNLKAEMQRKYGNVESQLAQLTAANKALAEQLAAKSGPAKGEEEIDEDLAFKPKELIKKVKDSVRAEINQELSAQQQAQNERVQAIAALAKEFPEVNKADSEFYRETLSALESLPENIRFTKYGYQTAVYQAAASLGVKPMSKRGRSQEDKNGDFSFSANKSSGPKKKTSARDDIDEKTLLWAEALGIDVNDEAELEDLRKYSKRNFRIPE